MSGFKPCVSRDELFRFVLRAAMENGCRIARAHVSKKISHTNVDSFWA